MANMVRIKTPTGKLRQEPRPDGQVLLELTQGQDLELLEHKPRYSQVRYRDNFREAEGWVANVVIGLPDVKGRIPDGQPQIITCPFCGTDKWVEKRIHAHSYSVMLGGSFFTARYARSRICVGCGYVQLHVGQEDLQQLREEYEEQSGTI